MKLTRAQIEIETALRYLGVSGTKKGFWGIIWGVSFVMEDPTLLYCVTRDLYPAIGRAMGMNNDCILRDMRALVEWCWNFGDREALREISGRRIMDKPSVGEFIDMLAGYMRRKGY